MVGTSGIRRLPHEFHLTATIRKPILIDTNVGKGQIPSLDRSTDVAPHLIDGRDVTFPRLPAKLLDGNPANRLRKCTHVRLRMEDGDVNEISHLGFKGSDCRWKRAEYQGNVRAGLRWSI